MYTSDLVQSVDQGADDVMVNDIIVSQPRPDSDPHHGENPKAQSLEPIEFDEGSRPAVIPMPARPRVDYHFQTLQQWEGVVVERTDDSFTARLRSLGASMPEKRVTVPLEELSNADVPLAQSGAVFYWTIGYRIELHGQKSLSSVIKFRRLPAWTQREIARIQESAARLDLFFE